MFSQAFKLVGFCIILLMLAAPLKAQNTKGDQPPQSRDTRFSKALNEKKKPEKKRIRQKRASSSLRAYRPRKQGRGGETAGRPVAPLRKPEQDKKPVDYSNRPWSTARPSQNRRTSEERAARTAARRRVQPRSASGSIRNVYPQPSATTNFSSKKRIESKVQKRRVVPKSASKPFIRHRSVNSWTSFPKPKPRKEKAYQGDIAGRPLRRKNYESPKPGVVNAPASVKRSAKNAGRPYFQQKGNVTIQSWPRETERASSNSDELAYSKFKQSGPPTGPGKKKRIRRSASGQFLARRSTNTWARFAKTKRKGERAITTDLAGKPLFRKNFESRKPGIIPQKERRRPRGDDQPYVERNPKVIGTATRTGRAWKGDITGRKVRRKNETSKRSIEGNVQGKLPGKYAGKGKRVSGFQGNVRSQRGFGNQGEQFTGFLKSRRAAKGGGSVTRRWNNDGIPIPGRAPGLGASSIAKFRGNKSQRRGFGNQGEEYNGSIKSRRPFKGGGSASGRWNNNGLPIRGKSPGIGAFGINLYKGDVRGKKRLRNQGEEYRGNNRTGKGFNDQGEEFSGMFKARRPVKGGGSISGKLWNNNNVPLPARAPGIGGTSIRGFRGTKASAKGFSNQGEEFTGNIKARKPVKGGGSISARRWNNDYKPIAPRTPGVGASSMRNFSGNLKMQKRVKGGGSVSGRLWNNDESPIPPRTPGIGGSSMRNFSGNLKMQRRAKGGGSVSGKLWNNDESPIAPKTPGIGGTSMRNYRGTKTFPKGFSDQGEEFTGHIKARRPAKGGGSVSGRLWNNNETPIAVRTPASGADAVGDFSGKSKQKKYQRNPNVAEGALLRPREKTASLVDGLQVRVKQRDHGIRKNAPDGVIPTLKPGKESLKASEYTRVIKRDWRYVKNPSSNDLALKIREPGKAFAKATDYQGNMKMKKYDLFGRKNLHPDAQFVKLNKNNVDSEKDALTNFKLWWARLFKKNDTQPGHLKDRGHKPRYDPGEKGLWYD